MEEGWEQAQETHYKEPRVSSKNHIQGSFECKVCAFIDCKPFLFFWFVWCKFLVRQSFPAILF